MNIKSFFAYALLAAVIWAGICVARPYWNRYNIATELEIVAIYGTKHEASDMKKMIKDKIAEKNWPFDLKDVTVTKYEDNDVLIAVTYPETIKIFGLEVKTLEMTVKQEARNVKPIL